jgi:hypothetical protein
MSDSVEVDLGPLARLVGSWSGEKGKDVSPDPDGTEENSYREKLVFTSAGEVDNAEEETLVAVHYHQTVVRIDDNKDIHNQTGYWIWHKDSGKLMHSFSIPRGVAILAGGSIEFSEANADKPVVLSVAASLGGEEWGIQQSAFMLKNASTESFEQVLTLRENKLSYSQTMVLNIYGKTFKHTDKSALTRDE